MTRSNTADLILDQAETLIQSRGYSAFSYHDIAVALGVTKASIHYHFPSKSDLGAAVIERYAGRLRSALAALSANPDISSLQLLEHYTTPYLAVGETPDRICLSAALAGEIMALPPEVRDHVRRFFLEHQSWLEGIFSRGAARGEFSVRDSPIATARMAFGALQGALIVKRATGDLSQLQDVIAILKAQLTR
ncbi:MAG: TetR/AcrR family transcriptional regulator [Elsteraceae bacterium]